MELLTSTEDLTSEEDLTLDDVEPYVSPAKPVALNTFESIETPDFDLEKPEGIAAPYVAPTYEAPEPYVPGEDATVAGQMNKLTAENSAYMQQATAAGERSAQAKGLLNSTMAGTAGRSAALAAAAPIATADAGTFAEAGLAGYKGKLDAALVGMNDESQHNLTLLTGKINADLAFQSTIQQDYINARNTALQSMYSSKLSAQEAEAVLISYEYQGLINAGLNDRQAQDKINQIKIESDNAMALDQQQQQGANDRAEIEKNLKLAELNSNDQASVSTAMTNYGLQFQKDTSSIQLDTNTSGIEKTRKLWAAQQVYEMNMQSLASLYDVEITWDTPFITVDEDQIKADIAAQAANEVAIAQAAAAKARADADLAAANAIAPPAIGGA